MYKGHIRLFTDCLKTKDGVDAAVEWNGRVKVALLREASIYSAEIHAIVMAINIITETAGNQFVILSHSYTPLKTLCDIRTQ